MQRNFTLASRGNSLRQENLINVNIHGGAAQVQSIPHVTHHERNMVLSHRSSVLHLATQMFMNSGCAFQRAIRYLTFWEELGSGSQV